MLEKNQTNKIIQHENITVSDIYTSLFLKNTSSDLVTTICRSILQCHKCRACIMCKMLSMAAAVLHFQQSSVAFSCVSSVWEIDGDQ